MNVTVTYGIREYTFQMPNEAKVSDLKKKLEEKLRVNPANITLGKDAIYLIDEKELRRFGDGSLTCFLILKLKIFIRSGEQNFEFQISSESTVKQLKEQLAVKINMSISDIHLVYMEQPLEDGRKLCMYEMANNSTLIRIAYEAGGNKH